MRASFMIVFACLATSACAADNSEKINAWYQQRKAQCTQEPLTRGNVVQETDCVSDALIEANTARRSPLLTNANEFVSVQHEVATAYAEGKISRDEFFYRYNAAKARYNSTAIQYDQQNQAASDNQNLQVLLLMHQAVTPQYVPAVNCNTYYTGPVAQTNCY